jgi:Glycosyl hydrolase family 79 C-terminal beta domain
MTPKSGAFVTLLTSLLFLRLTLALPQSSTTGTAAKRSPGALSINVASSPDGAGLPVLEAFLSYSIELAFWPDYAGNLTAPNTFSYNLLSNLEAEQGVRSLIRVGGNTQSVPNRITQEILLTKEFGRDYAIYDPNLAAATVGTQTAASQDYPTILNISAAFFESYLTLDTKHTHGFNLGRNSTAAREALLQSVPVACKALSHGNLAYWELGNEPDLFKTSAQGVVRPRNWAEQDYVNEWLTWTGRIRDEMAAACPDLASSEKFKWYAPSFAGTHNSLDPVIPWKDGLYNESDIAVITSHNYIGGATQPGVTLRHTLMNHTSTTSSLSSQFNVSKIVSTLPGSKGLPFILGETNSLYNEGAPGLSNSFGAALWSLDFALYSAANSIQRIHFHQGTDYRYASWQPVTTNKTAMGTKAPYYANVATAAMVGKYCNTSPTQIKTLLGNESYTAYGAYENGALKRIMAVNLEQYNYTSTNGSVNSAARPKTTYWFSAPTGCAGAAMVSRLMANGSDAITGITWGGYSFNYELQKGNPVLQTNVTKEEAVLIGEDGTLLLDVSASSAAMVKLTCKSK